MFCLWLITVCKQRFSLFAISLLLAPCLIRLIISSSLIENYVGRINFFDGNGYVDHEYFFFTLAPSTNVSILSNVINSLSIVL